MRILSKAIATTVVGVNLAGLTGCATTAELESLRAEVATANAMADRTAADVAQIKKELAKLIAAQKAGKSSTNSYEQKYGRPANPDRPAGYKWGYK